MTLTQGREQLRNENDTALDAIDFLIRETAEEANRLATTTYLFDDIGAGTGVGIRLKALKDARAAVVDFALEQAKEMADG
jgi:hypothetical protein